MRSSSFGAALAVGVVVCAAAAAKDQTLTAIGKDEDDALQQVLTKVVERVLKEEGLLDQVTGKDRDELIQACAPLLTQKRFTPFRGDRTKLTCKVDSDQVREKVTSRGKAAAKAEKVALAMELRGKQGEPQETLTRLVRNAFAARLKKSGHDLLEGDPKAAPKDALVAVVSLELHFEPFKPNEAKGQVHQGVLRPRGSTIKLYDKAGDAVLLQQNLVSDKDAPEPPEGRADYERLHELTVPKDASLAEKEERYADFLGGYLAQLVAKKLSARAAELGPTKAGSVKAGYIQVRFKGFAADVEVGKLLEGAPGVSELKPAGKVAVFDVYRIKYAGGDLDAYLVAGLKKKGLAAKTTQVGATLNVLAE